ncbi:SAGA-associated factor 11 [Linum perenne]
MFSFIIMGTCKLIQNHSEPFHGCPLKQRAVAAAMIVTSQCGEKLFELDNIDKIRMKIFPNTSLAVTIPRTIAVSATTSNRAVWPSSELSELLMSSPNEDNTSPPTQVSSHVFVNLLDCHRVAKLGLDRNLEEEELKLSASAGLDGTKFVVDMFGQTHPPFANEVFECINCGRSVAAGRVAPHLEKCIGKGEGPSEGNTK